MGARRLLLVGSLVSAALFAYHGAPLVTAGADRRAHLPGRTSRGHAAFEAACEACHTPFRGVTNAACLRCHEAGLTAGEDSHAASKLADPRRAAHARALDARACATCHREHDPRHTRPLGVTLPEDFCAACHADIARERPSHQGFPFTGCAAVGCHNFHDNRSLFEDFLKKHLRDPEDLPRAAIAPRTRIRPAGPALAAADADAPPEARRDEAVRGWAESGHARAGVNCTACHGGPGGGAWRDHPGGDACRGCHDDEREGFLHGQHGVRVAVGLSPLTPAMARLPMKPDAAARPLDCEACHGAHAYDTSRAAADACLGCHDDRHSRGWTASRHAVAFRREQRGEADPGTGVSCATCHLPRASRRVRGEPVTSATHDVSAALRPRDKMIRAVCARCHGVGFALDALADPDLVARGLNGRPTVHVESLSLVDRRARSDPRAGGTP